MLELAAILPHLFPIVGAVFSFMFMTVVIFILIKGIRGINVTDLFEFKGEASLSKFWQNVAYAAATIAFLAINISGNLSGSSLEIVWLIYLGVVASNAVLSKWISVKYNRTEDKQDENRYDGNYGGYRPNRYDGRNGNGYQPHPMRPQKRGTIPEDDSPSKVDSPD